MKVSVAATLVSCHHHSPMEESISYHPCRIWGAGHQHIYQACCQKPSTIAKPGCPAEAGRTPSDPVAPVGRDRLRWAHTEILRLPSSPPLLVRVSVSNDQIVNRRSELWVCVRHTKSFELSPPSTSPHTISNYRRCIIFQRIQIPQLLSYARLDGDFDGAKAIG